MKIALFGYGKMGKTIERIALDRNHTVPVKIDKDNTVFDLEAVDVAIDFSTPHSAFSNVTECFRMGVPMVCGTTGWLDRYDEAIELCKKYKGAFIYSSNFSLGVNLFFSLNNYLAKMIGENSKYKASIEEVHHTQKLDAPSGTAISLSEGVIANTSYEKWSLKPKDDKDLPIVAIRKDNVHGIHKVTYKNEIDAIEISHTAYSRDGFALGAVVAAEWLVGKTGVFSMKNVLGLLK